MSRSAVSPDVARGPLIPFLYFIMPLVTASTPRFSPFLLLLLAFVVIVAGLRRGFPLRALIKPNAAMVALLAVALYDNTHPTRKMHPEGASRAAGYQLCH